MTSRSDLAPDAGFTLIELIVVIAVLGLIMVLVVVNGTPVSPGTHARGAAQAISGALRSARGAAVANNRSVEFTLDLARRTYRWGDTPAEFLANDLRLALLTNRDELVAGDIGRIRFNPDGSSSGGRVSVTGGTRTWWIGVDWLSGRVSIAEKPS